jgi:hypothetical protein
MNSQANQSTNWGGANALAILVGGNSDDLRYLKSISLHLWLFGYELPGDQRSLGLVGMICSKTSCRIHNVSMPLLTQTPCCYSPRPRCTSSPAPRRVSRRMHARMVTVSFIQTLHGCGPSFPLHMH